MFFSIFFPLTITLIQYYVVFFEIGIKISLNGGIMENRNDSQKTNAGNSVSDPPDRSVVTLTVIGTLIVLLGFYILYGGERSNNKQWIAKSADLIDPAKPEGASGMVRFTGTATGDFIPDEVSGESFVIVTRTVYEFREVKKSRFEPVVRDGKTGSVSRDYYEDDWDQVSGDTRKATNLKIGEISIRLNEAEIIGRHEWRKTYYITDGKKSGTPPEKPAHGNKKYSISGINGTMPLFVVGNLTNHYLGSGPLFIVSAWSEGKTLEELRETWIWRWIRHPFCFGLLFVGFIFLIHPTMLLLKRYREYPVIGFFSNIGWVLFIFISFILSFLIVSFSEITVDLIWIILLALIVVPVISVYKKKSLI